MQELSLFNQQSIQPRENIPSANKIDTYYQKIQPELTKRESDVYEVVNLIQPCTMHDVAKEMNVPLNTISGRFSALVKKEVLEIKGRTADRKSIYKTRGN